jgi:hypothetical protein
MKLKTRSILQELNEIADIRNRDALYETRAINIINSAINLIESLKTHYSEEDAEELERRLINSIRGKDSAKFVRGIKKIAESKKTNLGTQSDVDKIVDAIEKISKPTKKVKKRGFIQSFFGLIMMLVLIVLLIFAALYAVWRLDITYGYENIELIGTLLRDEVIIPLFGSAHYLA